jgi:Flp pilus assembly protein TadD/mono/diheme cytochrome c family protein
MKIYDRLLCMGCGLASMTALSGLFGARHEVCAADAPVTYNRQIAPILYKHCTSCHHAGGSGPFSLMTYDDAKRWGPVVESVTQARYMPPWLPSGPHDQFADDRRLSAEEIGLIRRWVQAGMLPGDAADAVVAPVYTSDWQLSPPDLVVEMETPMTVPASGTDLYRNFILPLPLKGTHWVRAMEIKPGTPQVVHHANLITDRTESMRRSHPNDWRAGIPGMDVMVDAGESFDPDGHFLYWKPDSSALVEPPGLAWRLDGGDDLVLNMHLKPTGKVETVKARIGLYFTSEPAKQPPMLLQLENDAALDIPAGEKDFAVEDELKLPEDVDLLAIYPHAHYLGRRLEGWAQLPGGRRESLILIESWDIDRQSIYRYAKPLFLPAGTVVHMRYTYDNSAGNPRNPNSPPIRVKAGNRSVDEMGHLWLQVLPRASSATEDARVPLLRAWMEHRLQKDPMDPIALFNVASLDMSAGEYGKAAELYRKVMLTRPGDARTMTALASALNQTGDWRGALALLDTAQKADASYVDASFDLGAIELQHGDYAGAERQFRAVLGLDPEDAAARSALGGILLATDRAAEARAQLEAALKTDGRNFNALYNLGMMELEAGQVESALNHLFAAESVHPEDVEVHRALADIYGRRGDTANAAREQKAGAVKGPQ